MADISLLIDVDTEALVQSRREIRNWAKASRDHIDVVNSRMKTVGKTSELAYNQLGRSASRAQTKMKRFGSVGMQQVGYQVQDFAVQIQSGTNALVSLGQQGSQLLGIFGPAGAIGGMILAIGTGLAGAFIAAKNAAQKAVTDFEGVGSALREIESLDFDNVGFGALEIAKDIRGEYEAILSIMRDIKVEELRTALKKPAQAVEEEIRDAIYRGLVGLDEDIDILGLDTLSEAKFVLAQINTLTGETKEELTGQLQAMTEALTLRGLMTDEVKATLSAIAEEIDLVSVVSDRISDAEKGAQALAREVLDVLDATAKAAESARSLADEIGEGAVKALELAGVDITSGVDDAAKAAAKLASALGVSLGRAKAIQSMSVQQAMGQGQAGGTGMYGGEGPNDPAGFYSSYQTGDYNPTGFSVGSPLDSGSGGGSSAVNTYEQAKEALDNLIASYDEAEAAQLKVAKAQEIVNKALKQGVIDGDEAAQIMKDYENSLKSAESTMQSLGKTMSDSFGNAIMSIVDGTKTAEEAFKDMAREILKEAFRLMVIKPLMNTLFGGSGGGGLFGSLFPSAKGNVFSGGDVVPYANGGVVSSPTLFPMKGSKTGLMGEAGPEAILPLKRGKGGKLGVIAETNSQPVVIHQNFNFSANGDESVKRIIQQEAPKIASYTQGKILEERRRGGAWKSTFG